jgi:4-amino-4-deoxy-L-arabinose transferase-like glycosyltransferase
MHVTGSLIKDRPLVLKFPALLAAFVFVFLVCFAGRYGFHSDELYFLACAQHPAWGYVDLPPLLPWLTWIVMHTLGTSLTAVRLYAALATSATVLFAARLASELGGRRRAVITAALLTAITPVALAFGHLLTTNALDMPLWAAAVLFSGAPSRNHLQTGKVKSSILICR